MQIDNMTNPDVSQSNTYVFGGELKSTRDYVVIEQIVGILIQFVWVLPLHTKMLI